MTRYNPIERKDIKDKRSQDPIVQCQRMKLKKSKTTWVNLINSGSRITLEKRKGQK